MERKDELEKRNERIAPRERPHDLSGGSIILGLVGGLAVIGIAALIVVALPDIKRYYKISTM